METQDLYEQEERCLKAIRTVRRAVFMRFVICVLLLLAAVMAPAGVWIWGLMIFVLILNITGSLPLITEWKKQKVRLKELIAQEES